MNLRQRLQLRTLINFIVSIIERLVKLSQSVSKPNTIKPSPKKNNRPLKKIIDNLLPWRNTDE